MRCETFLDRYDRLDAGERPGPALRAHLSACPACRARIEREAAAITAYRTGKADPRLPILEERVMAAIRLTPRPRRVVLLRDWIVAGLVIALSMALIPLGEEFDLVKEAFGPRYAMPLSLVLGLVLTVYIAVFIGSHLDEFGAMLRRHEGRAHSA